MEEKRWYANDPHEPYARPVDCLPLNDTTWLWLYADKIRTVADVVHAYQSQPNPCSRLKIAYQLARLEDPLKVDFHFQRKMMDRIWEKLFQIEETPLESWPFHAGTLNALRQNKIENLGDLARYLPSELLRMRGLGHQRVAQCREFVAFHNLCFGLR